MTDEDRNILRLTLPCDPSALSTARDALNEITEIAPIRDNVVLIATELITNAVLHSRGGPTDSIKLDLRLSPDHVVITVHDPGISDQTPRVAPGPAPPPYRRLGLRLVQRIADRWGTERLDGRYVWAELAI